MPAVPTDPVEPGVEAPPSIQPPPRPRRPLKPLADPGLLDTYRDVFVPHERYPHIWMRYRDGWFPTGFRSPQDRRVLTRGHILLHLRGHSLFAVRWSTEKLTRLAVIDLDDAPGLGMPAERAELVLAALGRPPHLRINSSRHLGRLHLYLAFDRWERGGHIREALERRLTRAGLPIRTGLVEIWPNNQVLRLPLGTGSFLRDPVTGLALHARTELISKVPRGARRHVERVAQILGENLLPADAWMSELGLRAHLEGVLGRGVNEDTARLLGRFHRHLVGDDEDEEPLLARSSEAVSRAFRRFVDNQCEIRILRDPEADLRAVATFAANPANLVPLGDMLGWHVPVPERVRIAEPREPTAPAILELAAAAPETASRPEAARGRIVRPAFFPKATGAAYHRLVAEGRSGIPAVGRRLDTAMRMAFQFAMASATEREANTRIDEWLTAGSHTSRDLNRRGPRLVAKMLRDARRYQEILFQRRAAGAYYPYPGSPGSRPACRRRSRREFDEAAQRTLVELRERFGPGWRRHVRSLVTPNDRRRLGQIAHAQLGRDALLVVGFLRYGAGARGPRRIISLSSRTLQSMVGGRALADVPDIPGLRARYHRVRTELARLGYLRWRAPAYRGVRATLFEVDLTRPDDPAPDSPKTAAPARAASADPASAGAAVAPPPPRTLLRTLRDTQVPSPAPVLRAEPRPPARGPPGGPEPLDRPPGPTPSAPGSR